MYPYKFGHVYIKTYLSGNYIIYKIDDNDTDKCKVLYATFPWMYIEIVKRPPGGINIVDMGTDVPNDEQLEMIIVGLKL